MADARARFTATRVRTERLIEESIRSVFFRGFDRKKVRCRSKIFVVNIVNSTSNDRKNACLDDQNMSSSRSEMIQRKKSTAKISFHARMLSLQEKPMKRTVHGLEVRSHGC